MSEFLLALGVTLLVLDFFVAGEIPSILAYVIFSYLVVDIFDVGLLYSAALGLVAFGLMLVFHFQVLRALSAVVVDKFVSPTKLASGDDSLVGQKGTITTVSGKRFVKVGDQLCHFEDESNLPDDTAVVVRGAKEGKLTISELANK